MEEREDEETSSTSSSQCSSSHWRIHCSPLSLTKNCTMANWNTGAFRAWKERFHGQVAQVDNVHDSQTCQVETTPLESVQPHYDFTSEEEFVRLMNEPPPSTFSVNDQSVRNVFSCPSAFRNPLPIPSLSPPIVQGVTFSEPPVHIQAGENVMSTKRPPKKTAGRKGKKAKTVVEVSDEDEDADEGCTGSRWTDLEISHLISFRLEMDDEFTRKAKKQGVSSWDKLQNLMIAACENFTKSSESYRNKWKAIFRQYCNDKRLLQVSGEGRKVTCKFFEEIDQGFNNVANVKKFVHSDGCGTPNPCPLDLPENGGEGQGSGESCDVSPSSGRTTPSKMSSHSTKANKKSSAEVNAGLLSDIVLHTKSIATDIHDNHAVIKDIRDQLDRLIDKL